MGTVHCNFNFEYGTTCNLLVLYYDIPGIHVCSAFLENFNVNFEEAESTFISEFHFLCRICIIERLMKLEKFRRMKELDILDILNSICCMIVSLFSDCLPFSVKNYMYFSKVIPVLK